MSCVFCDSRFADPIMPVIRQRVCSLFDVSFNGKKLLHDGKICTRCQINVDLIESAVKLKSEMSQCLLEKLGGGHLVTNGGSPPKGESVPESHSHQALHTASPVSLPTSLSKPPEVRLFAPVPPKLELPVVPTPPVPTSVPAPHVGLPSEATASVYMCIHCGAAFKAHADLLLHDKICVGSQTDQAPLDCERCGQNLKYRTPDDRYKHILQCQGQGLRRGRPSTGIFNCPKCGLGLKNRMNHDRLNHVQRCTGSGLKRGRPSLKSAEKFQCDKCGRNLWSRDQLDVHSAKCDGTHVERRGRRPRDNTCMVCGENLVYRHILKKHLRHAHGINPQNLDDSVGPAVKSEEAWGDNSSSFIGGHNPQPANSEQSYQDVKVEPEELKPTGAVSDVNHRKQGRPIKYIPELFVCNTCNKRFEHKAVFDNHSCFRMQRQVNGDHEEGVDNSIDDTNGAHSPNNQDNGASEASEDMELQIDVSEECSPDSRDRDIINAISTKTQLSKQGASSPAVRGSAIAQVISDLLGASRNGAASTPIQQQPVLCASPALQI